MDYPKTSSKQLESDFTMLLSPSLSPSPLDSPSTTTMPPPPPLPPPQPLLSPPSPPLLTPHLAPTSTPPLQQPPLLPVISRPPPAAVAISPVTTPPLSPVVTSPPPTPSATTTIGPIASPPPPALVIVPPPQPQPPTTLPLPPPSLIPPPPSLPPPPLTTAPSLPPPRLPIYAPPPPQPPLVIIPPPLPPTTLPLPPPSLILPPPLAKAPSLAPPPLTKAPSLPPPRLRIDPPPFTSTSPPQPPASPAAPAASHSIKSPKTPGPFQAIPSPAQPPPPVSFQSFPPPAPPPPPLTLTGRKGGLSTTKQTPHSPIGLIVASIGVTILLFVVLALVCICCKRRSRKHKPLDTKKQHCSVQKVSIQHKQANVVNDALGSGSINLATIIADNTTLNSSIDGIFTYEELVIATDGFSESNLLGQGGFGYVYKGRLSTGQDVAVKKLKAGSRQGEREFRAEVETISRVHHRHLVSLVGYCIDGAERLLVYEFVTNKTLEFHLYENGQPVMVWESRLKIAIGSAKGLAYLHEDCSPTIIHRDIKAANILLDMRFEAKVSDFGLAKIFFDESSSITHISTRVMGTFGYLAPEYALTGKLTDKSDVYSYGVMLLELITGRPPIIEQDSSTNQSLVDWARPLLARALEDNDFDTLVDRRLNGSYNKSKMASMVSCAAACIRQSAWLRPRLIQVVRALEDDISLPYLDEGTRFSNSSSNASSDTFIRNAKRCINDVGFREHSETTSEYGM